MFTPRPIEERKKEKKRACKFIYFLVFRHLHGRPFNTSAQEKIILGFEKINEMYLSYQCILFSTYKKTVMN